MGRRDWRGGAVGSLIWTKKFAPFLSIAIEASRNRGHHNKQINLFSKGRPVRREQKKQKFQTKRIETTDSHITEQIINSQ